MDVKELFQVQDEQIDYNKVISELKSKRYIDEPDTATYEKQLEPTEHDVYDKIKRPDKKVKIDPDDPDYHTNENNSTIVSGSGDKPGYRYESVARVALAIQKLIVKRAVSFIFGNPVTLDCTPVTDNEKIIFKAIKRVMYDVKEKSLNRNVARNLFSSTEVAELWYPVENKNNTYGFDSKFKLRCAVFSPLNGDSLYPYFDETGDMTAFSRGFTRTNSQKKTETFFETYTSEYHYLWKQGSNGYEIQEGFPKENAIGKIPVVFGNQTQVEWADVQNLIDRLEKLLSNFADTNDYHASPKIFIEGELKGFAKKGEAGAILQGETGTKASYLSWANAPEAVKLEIETLLKMIYTITQTPDISFDAVKGLNVSGIALKLLFMDAHLKVADHQEVFDQYLQRRINIIKSFIGTFNTKYESDAENLMVEPVITPYMIIDKAAEMKIWSDANGGNAIISQEASFIKAGLTNDPESDFKTYQNEQNSNNQFSLNEPTLP
jgi:SPP1 family phage portal protein